MVAVGSKEGALRVAHLAHLSEWSGAPAVAARLAHAMARADSELEVAVWYPGPGEAVDRARQLGVAVEVLCQRQGNVGGLRALLDKLMDAIRLGKALKSRSVEVAWIHGTANIWLGLGAWWGGCRILWHSHEAEVPGERLGRGIRHWLIRRLAGGLVFAGGSGRRAFLEWGPIPVSVRDFGVMGNPMDSEVWSRLASEPVEGPAPPGASGEVVIGASGLYRRKGADRLLRGVALWGRPVRVLLMGEGRVGEKSFLEELQRLVGGLPPGVEVEWLGQVGAVRDVLKRCHVFASLSRAEQAPLLLVEAMALGVPVVVTDVGDQAAMVDYGRLGEVVSGDGKAEEVAGALQRIMDPLRESAGLREEAARAWALGNHDPGVLGQEAAKVVHLLCSRPYHPSQPTMEG